MRNPYERMRKLLAASERKRAGGKPRDRVSPKPLAYEPRSPEARHAKRAGLTEDQQRMLDDEIDNAGP